MKTPAVNPAAIGGFFIRHGEKLAFAALGLFGLTMVWWGIDAVRSQSVDKSRSPQAVQELANQAAAHIESVAKPPAGRVPSLPPLSPRVDPWRPQQVKIVDTRSPPAIFNRPLAAELTKRTRPQVLPIEDLQATAGIAVLPDPVARAGGAAPVPAAPAGEPQPPEPEEPRGGKRPRRKPREEGLFSAIDLPTPATADLAATQPAEPGRITPFIVVTGLVPTAKQRAEFEKRFGAVSFRDPRRDVPRWGEYIVERTRVVPGANPRWERLKIVNVERAGQGQAGPEAGRPGVRSVAKDGGGDAPPPLMPETLPGGFLLQPGETEVGYVAALPERIDEPWGTAAFHPWFVPELKKFLAGEMGKAEQPGMAGDATLADLKAKPLGFVGKEVRLARVSLDPAPERQRNVGLYKFGVRSADGSEAVELQTIGQVEKLVFATSADWGAKLSFDVGDKPRACNLRTRIDMVGKTPVARILEIELLDDVGEVTSTRAEPNPEPVEVTDAMGLPAGVPAGAPGFVGPLSENRLFRFIDTAVEPGAEYRYRVRFALRNPNVGLAPQHVADLAITRGDFLVSEYSNETPAVRVPDPKRVLARTIPREAARKLKVKPDVVEVLVLSDSKESGNFALRSTVTPLGGLINVDPALNRPANVRFFGEPVTTDRVLVDVRGPQEERTDGRSQVPPEPLEMLLLRPDGRFEFVGAADSELLVRKYRSTLFKPGEEAPDDGKPKSRDRDSSPRGFP